MRCLVSIIWLLQLIASSTFGQVSKTDSSRINKFEKKYRTLKDSILLHPLIPTVSPIIINYRELEIITASSLTSTTRYFDGDGNKIDLMLRQTAFYNTLQLTYGLSRDTTLNVGIDVNTVFARLDQNASSSPFDVFSLNSYGNTREAKAVTSLVPRIRWLPFKKNKNFTIQNSFGLPMALSSASKNVLGTGQFYFLTQFLYNEPLSKRFFLFGQLGFEYLFKRDDAHSSIYCPEAVYLSYLATKKIIFFALGDYIPVFTKENKWTYNRHVTQAGGGVQYQLSNILLVNGLYAVNLTGENYPAGNNFNFSLRILIK